MAASKRPPRTTTPRKLASGGASHPAPVKKKPRSAAGSNEPMSPATELRALDLAAENYHESSAVEASRDYMGPTAYKRHIKRLAELGFIERRFVAAGRTPIGGSWGAGNRVLVTNEGRARAQQLIEEMVAAGETRARIVEDHPHITGVQRVLEELKSRGMSNPSPLDGASEDTLRYVRDHAESPAVRTALHIHRFKALGLERSVRDLASSPQSSVEELTAAWRAFGARLPDSLLRQVVGAVDDAGLLEAGGADLDGPVVQAIRDSLEGRRSGFPSSFHSQDGSHPVAARRIRLALESSLGGEPPASLDPSRWLELAHQLPGGVSSLTAEQVRKALAAHVASWEALPAEDLERKVSAQTTDLLEDATRVSNDFARTLQQRLIALLSQPGVPPYGYLDGWKSVEDELEDLKRFVVR